MNGMFGLFIVRFVSLERDLDSFSEAFVVESV